MALVNNRKYKTNKAFVKRHYFMIGEVLAKCSDKETIERFIKMFRMDNGDFKEGTFREYLEIEKAKLK